MKPAIRILALDAGAGTQDIVLYESDREPENCVKLVLPSQTQVVATRIRRITSRARPLHLAGYLMGGGASSWLLAYQCPRSQTPRGHSTTTWIVSSAWASN
jgi:uncharacterized protein (DUF1786 family)